MRFSVSAGLLFVTACASLPTPALSPVPPEWRDVPHAAAAPAPAAVRKPATEVHILRTGGGAKLVNGTKDLTPEYRDIDSFDVSASRKEVVFSARRKDNFDVGLVALEGSDVHWIPEDPADETDVQWAPRGNKVSYAVHGRLGTLVRTVHVPSGVALTVDFPFASIRSLTWEPQAERYSVVYSTPEGSERVESVRYGGEERRIASPPAETLAGVTVEPLSGAVLLHPATLRYNEKLPLVIWTAHDRFAWDDARAALMRNARVAVAVVDDPKWNGWKDLQWVDPARIYTVGPLAPPRGERGRGEGSLRLSIIADPNQPKETYSRHGDQVTVDPSVVKSFAAGFIANQLKGNSPPNGNR